MSVITYEHHDLDEPDFCLHELCVEVVEPTNLQLDDNFLSIEYKYFSCGFDANLNLDEGFCVECNLFLLTSSKLTSFLNIAILNLLSLRILLLRILL